MSVSNTRLLGSELRFATRSTRCLKRRMCGRLRRVVGKIAIEASRLGKGHLKVVKSDCIGGRGRPIGGA